jgi:dihydroorotate dehydrogenase electron transfer subunit
MKHFSAEILSNAPVSDCFHELTFAWDAAAPTPGQFCTVRVSPYSAPLLRRPFAFSGYDASQKTASIIYKKRGPATRILSGLAAGGKCDIIGPLGTGFSAMPGFPFPSVLCIAGGTGIGPMLFMAESVACAGGVARLILGCRTAGNVPALGLLGKLGAVITTDDATKGYGGTPADYLAKLTKDRFRGFTVCACGPMPLLLACHNWAQAEGLACFAAIEQIMACGVGACMGCAIRVKTASGSTGFARACTEGPVFDSERIVWT